MDQPHNIHMKKLYKLFLILAILISGNLSSQICNASGNLVIYSNYDGGIININCDVNIPNLKIGICTYEAAEIHIIGTFSNNVTGVIYAGYDGSNDNCNLGVVTTTIIGSSSQTINVYPPVGYLAFHGNGNSSGMDGCHQCDTTTNSGGDNTPDEVVFYFLNAFPGSVLRSHETQYACWTPSTYNISAGGNCCIMPPNSTPCVPPPAPTNVTSAANQTVCAGQTVVLAVTSTASVNWFQTPTSTPVVGTGTNLNMNLSAGTYTFYAEAINSCSNSPRTPVTFTVHPLPNLTVAGTPSICMGQIATLTVTGASNYTWSTSQTTSVVSVSPASATVYTVRGKNVGNSCLGTKTIAVNVVTCTALYDISTYKINFNLFPNPVKHILNVEAFEGNKKIEITDITGKIIYSKECEESNLQIDMSKFSKGIYIFTIHQNGLSKHTRLIVE